MAEDDLYKELDRLEEANQKIEEQKKKHVDSERLMDEGVKRSYDFKRDDKDIFNESDLASYHSNEYLGTQISGETSHVSHEAA